MSEPSIQQLLGQLQTQQGCITRALWAADEGRWVAAESGADSVEGWLLALNPTLTGDLEPFSPMYTVPEPPLDTTDIEWFDSPNHYNGRAGMDVVAVVVHTMAGTLEACDGWFSNPTSQVSTHYGVGLDGEIHQYVDLRDGAWGNGVLEDGNRWVGLVGNEQNPNYQTVSIETEDRGSGLTPVTDEQFDGVLKAARVALLTFPRTLKYLVGHNIISARSRPHCCGKRWWNSGRFQQLADKLDLEAVF
jgi:hypothetical protein